MQSAINFTGYIGASCTNLDLRGECALRPAKQSCQHLACSVGIIVNRLLAEDNKSRPFGLDNTFEDLGDRKRLDKSIAFDKDAAIRAHCQTGTQRFRCSRWANRHNNHLIGLACLLEAQRFFDTDFVERIHRHFDVSEIHARTIRLHTDLHVVVNDTFNRHQNLHYVHLNLPEIIQAALTIFCRPTPTKKPLNQNETAADPKQLLFVLSIIREPSVGQSPTLLVVIRTCLTG